MPCHGLSSIMFSSLTNFRIDKACLFNMLIPASVYRVHMHWRMGIFWGRHILECNTFCPRAGCQGGHLQGGHPAFPHRDQVNSSKRSILGEMPISTVDRSQIHNADIYHNSLHLHPSSLLPSFPLHPSPLPLLPLHSPQPDGFQQPGMKLFLLHSIIPRLHFIIPRRCDSLMWSGTVLVYWQH